MKNALRLLALAALAVAIIPSVGTKSIVEPVAAATAVPTLTPQDGTSILGIYPYFPNGIFRDQYGNEFRSVIDSTSSTPAPAGKLLYFTGSTWIEAATANLALPRGAYGVVVQAASAQGGTAVIQTSGYVASASVKTGGSVACAATGDVPLASTTTGDLTPTAAASTPGVTLGACASALAVSQSATLISIVIGGY